MNPGKLKCAGLLIAASLLIACSRQKDQAPKTHTPTPSLTNTTTTQPTLRMIPSTTATPILITSPTIEPTPTSAFTPSPTEPLLETHGPLLESLAWGEIEGVSGYPFMALKGWQMGFRGADYCLTGPYRWLDEEHLLVFPITEHLEFEEGITADLTQPVVSSLSGEPPWAAGEPSQSCQLPVWSAAAQRVIEVVGEEVRLRDLEGHLTTRYPGKFPLDLAPSGYRLMAGGTWIDLQSGEVIPVPGWRSGGVSKIGWTADEQRVFGCCISYADLRNGDRWEQTEFPDFFIAGRGSWPGEQLFSVSHWIADDTKVIVDPLAIWFFNTKPSSDSVIPIFDPAGHIYVDLLTELDLGTPSYCSFSLAPDPNLLWLNCLVEGVGQMLPYEEAYRVDLRSLAVVTVTGQPQLLGWSAVDNYLVYNRSGVSNEVEEKTWIMNGAGEIRPLAHPAATQVIWHPSQPLGILTFDDQTELQIFNARTGEIRTLRMERPILQAIWQPNDGGFVMATQDGGLWWLQDAFTNSSEPVPITPPLPEVSSIRWSPGGSRVVFVSEKALYVVTIPGE